jgi:hypothetical protein
VVVLVTPEALAVTVTDCVELGEPAPAVNVALEAPAATVTEAGTVRKVLFENRETVKELEAVAVRFTVQVALAPAARVLGLHDTEFNAADNALTVTVPLLVVVATASPRTVALTALMTSTASEVLPSVGESVNATAATTPFPIVLVLTPISRQVVETVSLVQEICLPAAAAAAPALT